MIYILLQRGRGTIATLIKWQTRSAYSHAALLFRDGVVIESQAGHGVWKYHVSEVEGSPADWDVFVVDYVDEKAVRKFAEAQLGDRYDYASIVRFVTRAQAIRQDSGKWFCSELAFAAMAKGGIKVLSRIEPWEVSPEMLAISPLLKYQGRLDHFIEFGVNRPSSSRFREMGLAKFAWKNSPQPVTTAAK